jgi:hypothetical protein
MFKDPNNLLIIRDLTMMLLSFAGLLRYDEVSSLRLSCLLLIFSIDNTNIFPRFAIV